MHRTDAISQHAAALGAALGATLGAELGAVLGEALGALGDTVLAVLGGAGVSVAAPVLASVGVCAGLGWLVWLGSKAPITRSASPSTTHAAAIRTIVLVWSGTLAVCSIGVPFFWDHARVFLAPLAIRFRGGARRRKKNLAITVV